MSDDVVVDIFDYVTTTPPPVSFSSSPPISMFSSPYSSSPMNSPPSHNGYSTPPLTPFPSPSTSHFLYHNQVQHTNIHNFNSIPFSIETPYTPPTIAVPIATTTSATSATITPPSNLSTSPYSYDAFPVSYPPAHLRNTNDNNNPFVEKPVKGAPPPWSLDDVKNWTKLIALKKFATYRSDGDHPSAFSANDEADKESERSTEMEGGGKGEAERNGRHDALEVVSEGKLGFKSALSSAVRKLEATREVDRLTVDFKSKISVEKKNSKKKLKRVLKEKGIDLDIDAIEENQ